MRRWRQEDGMAERHVARADPVLRRAELARRFGCAPHLPKKLSVYFPDEPQRPHSALGYQTPKERYAACHGAAATVRVDATISGLSH
jgi:hypothetical protein